MTRAIADSDQEESQEQWLDAVGDFGAWQILVWLVCLGFYNSVNSAGVSGILFMQYSPEFSCASWDGNASDASGGDQCQKSFPNGTSYQCQKWTYANDTMERSIVTQWDLVCDSATSVADAQAVYQWGYAFACLFSGYLADRFGRSRVLTISGFLAGTFALLQAHVPNWTAFLVFRFFTCVAAFCFYGANIILALEITSNSGKSILGALIFVPWVFGTMVTITTVYFGRDWRIPITLQGAGMLTMALTFWFLPESPRWLISSGRVERARRTLTTAARVNGRLPLRADKEEVQEWQDAKLGFLANCGPSSPRLVDDDHRRSSSLLQALRHPKVFVRTAIVGLAWITVNLVYNGVFYSMGRFSGDLFTNNLIAGLLELPAYLAIAPLTKWSRRKGLALTLFVPAATFVAIPWLPESSWVFAFAMIGKTFIATAFGMVYIATPELYPTQMRTSALVLGSLLGRIGAISAPYIILLPLNGEEWRPVPQIIFAGFSFFAGLAVLLLPETKGQRMPETIAEITAGSFFHNAVSNVEDEKDHERSDLM